MLDLSKIKQQQYEFKWFDGSVLRLKRPSQELYEKLADLNGMDQDDLKSVSNLVNDLLYEIINENTEKRHFTKDEIEEEFDLGIAYVFMNDYANFYVPQLGE